jgi:hypothetical protein
MAGFICEPIEVEFEVVSGLKKRPGPPIRFVWRERSYEVAEILAEWHRYVSQPIPGKRPRYYIRSAQREGSWGVGRDFYRVRTECGGVYVIYYDRRPKGPEIDSGWFMYEVDQPSPRDD